MNGDPLAMRERQPVEPIRLSMPESLRHSLDGANAAQIAETYQRIAQEHSALMTSVLLLHQLLIAAGPTWPRPGTAREFLPRFEALLEAVRWLDGDRILHELEIDRETDRLIPHAGKILQGIRREILSEGPAVVMNRHREEWPELWQWLDRLPR